VLCSAGVSVAVCQCDQPECYKEEAVLCCRFTLAFSYTVPMYVSRRSAIEHWLSENDTSPITGEKLRTKDLYKNYSLM
jgi:hypothetical protein